MLVGYVQDSPLQLEIQEDEEFQHKQLKELGCEKIFTDQPKPMRMRLPQLQQALDYLRPNDILVVWRLSFLGKTTDEHIQILKYLKAKEIQLRAIVENIDTTTPEGKMAINSIISLENMGKPLSFFIDSNDVRDVELACQLLEGNYLGTPAHLEKSWEAPEIFRRRF